MKPRSRNAHSTASPTSRQARSRLLALALALFTLLAGGCRKTRSDTPPSAPVSSAPTERLRSPVPSRGSGLGEAEWARFDRDGRPRTPPSQRQRNGRERSAPPRGLERTTTDPTRGPFGTRVIVAQSPGALRFDPERWLSDTPRVLRDGAGRRYREVAIDGHVHSHYSGDAILPPDKVLTLAERRKLDAIVFTDHNSFAVYKVELPRSRTGLLVLYGMEAGLAGVHIGAWNLSEKPVFQKKGPGALRSFIRAVRDQPDTLLVLNHPGWRVGESYFRLETFVGPRDRTLDAVELWNGTFWQFVEGNISRWEEFLEKGIYVPAIANSDSHYFTLGTPRTMLWVSDRTTRGLLDAVRVGRGYMTDDARIVFVAEGALPGQLLRLERPGATIRVLLAGSSTNGGELRLFHKRRVIFEKTLAKGAFRFTTSLRADDRDGWLRVEIRRNKEIRTRNRFTYTLLTNPVLYDVPPYDDHWDLEREGRH